MPGLVLLRFIALILTVGLMLSTGGHSGYSERWESWVYILGFAHYLCALIYSQKQLQQLKGRYDFSWKIAGVTLASGPFLLMDNFSLLYLFGFHHAFNEAYLVDRATRPSGDRAVQNLRTASIALYLIVYLFLLKKEPGLDSVSPSLLAGALVAGYAVFFYSLARAKHLLSPLEFLENCAAEIFSLFVIALSFHYDVRFHHIVAYHFILWAIRPLPKFLRAGSDRLLKYVGLTSLLIGAAYLISPMGLIAYPLQGSFFYMQFAIWSFLHIVLSFALSDLHPGWMVRFFRPSARPAPLGE